MDNLPMPIQSEENNAPVQLAQTAPPSGQNVAMPTASNPKTLLEQATAQIEQIVAATPMNPSERAVQIQAVKAAYIKARYNLEIAVRQA